MRPRGSKFEYATQRDEDLIQTYLRHIRECRHIHIPSIIEKTINSPSRRFWVSEGRASIVLSRMFKGGRLHGMSPMKRAMYEELFRRASLLRQKDPSLSMTEIAFIVCNQPAPKFYLTPGSAKVLIHKIKKQWLRKRHARLPRPSH